ncbi:MAG TPA: FeoA family protein [Gammaproteobacteria bacterium]|nr:FeoA family protein [Gammaproteobacteria bacterium]
MKFSDLKIGDKACVISISQGESAYRQRLIAMGILPGTEFTVSRIAPLGDPIEIQVRGFALSLRKDEAAVLEIKIL